MKGFFYGLLLLCPLWNWAQPAKTALETGAALPAMTFTKLVNTTSSTLRTADYKERLLLIDFWATWCGACIKAFPKLDSLQEKYKGKLGVWLVNEASTGDRLAGLRSFWERHRRPDGNPFNLPVIAEDRQLGKWFPHRTMPHVAWIYKGHLIAQTAAEQVNSTNVETVLAGRPVDFETKEEDMEFDATRPLLGDPSGNPAAPFLLSQCVFTAYLPGANRSYGLTLSQDSNFKRRFFINCPLLRLYNFAWPDIPANRHLLETGDTRPFINDGSLPGWKKQFQYCYEMTVPRTMSKTALRDRMRRDLDTQFGLWSRVEKRTVDCWVLVRTNQATATLTGPAKGQWLTEWVESMNRQGPGLPLRPIILDETGMKEPFCLMVPAAPDIPACRAFLQQQGFDLLPASRELEMLVISKQDSFTKN